MRLEMAGRVLEIVVFCLHKVPREQIHACPCPILQNFYHTCDDVRNVGAEKRRGPERTRQYVPNCFPKPFPDSPWEKHALQGVANQKGRVVPRGTKVRDGTYAALVINQHAQ